MSTQQKHLVTIEFRYNDVSKDSSETQHKFKTLTIGVFDTVDDAITEGNKALEVFEKHFKLNPHWNRKERFSKNGGAFGSMHNLISDSAYLTTPFTFYAKITKLNYYDVESTILEVVEATKRYRAYKHSEDKN